MSAKSVVDIQVNASDFEKFSKLFADYSAKLDEMPAAWKELNAAMGDSATAQKEMAAAAVTAKDALEAAGFGALALEVALAKAVKAQESLGNASHGTNKRMSELAKTAKGLASDISGMGKWILRIGAAGIVGGALGGFGLGELTNALYSRGRAAGGVGLSPGRYASFLSYGQQFLGENALHAMAAAQTTYQSAPYFQMLGIDFNRARSMDTGILSFETLKGAVRNWQAAQKAGLPPASSPLVTAYESLGGSLEDVRRAVAQGGAPAINVREAQYRSGAASMEYDMKPWTDFQNQLKAAGMQIEATFGRALAPLIPEFTQFSKDVINALAAFVDSKDFGKIMGSIKDGLKSFLGWLEGPDAKKLADNLGTVSDEVFAVAQKLKWLLPQTPPIPEPAHDKNDSMHYDWGMKRWVDDSKGASYDPSSRSWQPLRWKALENALGSFWKNLTSGPINPKILDAISGQESSGNATVMNKDGSGAMGRYQFMPGTADGALGSDWVKKYGSTSTAKGRANFLGSPAAQTRAALAYLAELEKVAIAKHFKGAELIKAIAEGWYGGAGAVGNPNISGGVYGGHRYKTTGQYSDEVLIRLIKALMLQQNNGTKVSIVNSTAARVAISANAIATG